MMNPHMGPFYMGVFKIGAVFFFGRVSKICQKNGFRLSGEWRMLAPRVPEKTIGSHSGALHLCGDL